MDTMRLRATIPDLMAQLPTPDGGRSAVALEHGSMRVKIYAPRQRDPQQPHRQDEVYVVVQGSGHFVNGETRHPFTSGDVLFVPAGVVHRFEDFTEDLIVWVIFYGPDGGELSASEDV